MKNPSKNSRKKMSSSQKKGIGLIVGGVLLKIIILKIFLILGLYWPYELFYEYHIIDVIALILIGLGIKSLISPNAKEEVANIISADSDQDTDNLSNSNKVVKNTMMRECEFCGESILVKAKKCPKCNEWRKDIAGYKQKNITYMILQVLAGISIWVIWTQGLSNWARHAFFSDPGYFFKDYPVEAVILIVLMVIFIFSIIQAARYALAFSRATGTSFWTGG